MVLRFGAAAIPAFATLRASPAAATSSVLTCRVPLTMSSTGNKWIKSDGTLVAAGTAGSYGPLTTATGYYNGEELKNYGKGGSMPLSGKTMMTAGGGSTALTSSAFSAHAQYIQKLTIGKAGYTCFASIMDNWD